MKKTNKIKKDNGYYLYIEEDVTNTKQYTYEEIEREGYDPDDFYISHDMGGSVLYRYDHCREYTEAELVKIQKGIEKGDFDFGEQFLEELVEQIAPGHLPTYKKQRAAELKSIANGETEYAKSWRPWNTNIQDEGEDGRSE